MENLSEIIINNKLEMVDGNKILVFPTDINSFTTYPLPKNKVGCIIISFEEYFGLLDGENIFNDNLTEVIKKYR